MAELLYVNPGQTVREAIEVMKSNGISQLPVCKNTAFANAEVSGSIDELDVMEAISRDAGGPRHAGRTGDGPAAADDRRRPADREGGRDARGGTGLLVLAGGRPLP